MTPDPITQIFFEEAAELLRDFEQGVLQLEESPENAEVLNRIFRSAHTIKGTSGMIGFTSIARFTHTLEDLLHRLRKRELALSRPIVGTLLAAGDALGLLLERAKTGDDSEIQSVEATLAALTAHAHGETPPVSPAAPPRSPAPAANETLYVVRFRPPDDLLKRGLDPVRLLDDLASVGTVVDVEVDTSPLPALTEMDPEHAYLGFTCRLRTDKAPSAVEACFAFVGDPSAVTIDVVATKPTPAVVAGAATHTPPPPAAESRQETSSRGGEAATIRVPAAKIDRLVDLVGELVVTQSMIAQVLGLAGADRLDQLEELVAQMNRHTRELEERVMAIRMVPIRMLFGRFPRMIRDLGQAGGKELVVDTAGGETELDKSLIEQMTDPITHLLRNAVDHGIETPEVRRQAGKPAAGRITLAASQRSGNIVIEVADDGRGLDRERILTKAREMGFLGSSEALGDEDAFALIFRPGFSTAERVSEVSGRGVGMDVVYRNVRAAGGVLSIESVPGRGTRFIITLPLTLATLEGQVVRVGTDTYVLPLGSIAESIRPGRAELSTVLGGGEAIVLRGQVLPLLRLHRLFGCSTTVEDPTEGLVVIVEYGGRQVALLVDELLGQQQLVIKSLETNFLKVDGIAGATVLGDGRVALILDVAGIIALWRSNSVTVPVYVEQER